MPGDDASYLLCAEDAGGAFFFADVAASTCTTATDDDWCSRAEDEESAAASFVAELIGGEADYSPRSDYPDRLRSRCIDPTARADSVAWILKVTHAKAHTALINFLDWMRHACVVYFSEIKPHFKKSEIKLCHVHVFF
jgi:hypothetical protein